MSLPSFLNALFEDGRVSVAGVAVPSQEELAQGDEVLAAFEVEYRREMPSQAPEFSPAAARWAATMLHGACALTIFRDEDVATIEQTLDVPCPEPASPSVHYSVDLTFRFLPDLVKIARSASRDDPLVDRLTGWAAAWPVSSVGMPEIEPGEIGTFVDHPAMLALYVDRIIERADMSRLTDDRVREAVQQALGLFPELAPGVAEAIEKLSSEESV